MGIRERLAGWGRGRELALGGDRDFVATLYRLVLGREPDAGGLEHHLGRLNRGEVSRRALLRDFAFSDEGRHFLLVKCPPHKILHDPVAVASPEPFRPLVREEPLDGARLCELANPRKWLDPAWFAILRELAVVSLDLQDIHRKFYEFAQTVYGLRALGALGPEAEVLGVGAGHELLLYFLANQAGMVTATDLYEGDWAKANVREGDPAVLADPGRYAPFPYREERLRFLRMDGRELAFPDRSFDVVYSLSSIEHFGGHAAAGRAMAEMQRVLRPGGVAAVATELVVNGRPHPEFFRPEELLEHVVRPAGMPLVQAPEFVVPAHALQDPIRLPAEREHKPHLVLDDGGVLYTSVMLFFRKPA